MKCAIWGTDVVEETPRTGDRRVLNSPRAGGWYEIDGSNEALAASLSQDERLAVTRWLVSQRAMGNPSPKLDGTFPPFGKEETKAHIYRARKRSPCDC